MVFLVPKLCTIVSTYFLFIDIISMDHGGITEMRLKVLKHGNQGLLYFLMALGIEFILKR